VHQDAIGLYVEGKRHWLHVSSTQQLTHYQVHSRRGKEALDAIGILKDFQGVSVHDGWQSYWQYLCQHALCNVHHLRELTFLYKEQHQAWATELISLLLDIKAAVEQARNEGRKRLHPLEIEDWKAQFVSLLEAGYRANPPHSRLPLVVAQARLGCAGCSGTGLGRPSRFPCFLAYSNSHFLPLMLMLNVRYVYG
jgi:transposase